MTKTPFFTSFDASHAPPVSPINQNASPKRSMENRYKYVRFIMLGLSCFALFGSYYAYDNPAALERPLQTSFHLNSLQYNALYAVYSFPNVILPLFGGLLIDKLGASVGMILFMSLILAGQCLFAFGSSFSGGFFGLMIAGRTIFGFGAESLSVAGSALLAHWFKGKEMAFAMGFNLAVSRLGSVANYHISPVLYNRSGTVAAALWFSAGLLAVCLVGIVIMFLVDRWHSNLISNAKESDASDELERLNPESPLPEPTSPSE
eukprot:839911_1